MTVNFHIRDSEVSDLSALEQLYPDVFPNENLVPLVRDLLSDPSIAVSLVAVLDDQIIGHVVLTRCHPSSDSMSAALLGPLAVATDRQKRGIGSHIVRYGIERMKTERVQWLYVLGDPDYYQRFGFKPERLVKPPYPLRAEWSDAWQSIALNEDAVSVAAELNVPRQWQKAALWS